MSPTSTTLTEVRTVDVLIVGSGSAGLAAATWLSVMGIPSSSTSSNGGVTILEKRNAPLAMGQADGVQCRTVEMFESFGLSEELLREAYHVLEVSFWDDSTGWGSNGENGEGARKGKKLRRTRYSADTEKGLSWQPHVILNQARINGLLLEKMRREGGGVSVDYGWEVREVKLVEDGEWVRVVAASVEDESIREYKARYVLACDGAHSAVRKSIGYKMVGDSTDVVWGVCDVYPQTDFPDIRKKTTLHCDAGVLLIIPREGDSLARFYIEMPAGTKPKDVTMEDLHDTARKIFTAGGFKMEFADTAWWSAYSIGQRLAEAFSMGNRVFLTGDACHTHSPKAGQGMNVSLQDGYNIGWKLGMVLKGLAEPSLLKTYDLERGKVAADLVDFDRRWTKIIAGRKKGPQRENGHNGDSNSEQEQQSFSDAFIKAGRYMAGLTAKYDDSELTDAASSKQSLATNVIVGMRFPSAHVVRFCDAKPMQLARALPADGRWRVVIFAGDLQRQGSKARLDRLAEFLDSEGGPVRQYTQKGADIDSLIEPIVVLSGRRHATEQEHIHPYFWPTTGKWRMRDLHKVFVDDRDYNDIHGEIYRHCGVSVEHGAVVIVRPDQYVSKVCSLDDFGGIEASICGVFLRTDSDKGLQN
ncbi:3-hydroxybenzoate 4-monooxygenase [Cyphellophora attinorum]|uniref:3-hydroxybenzoate 4-monooxygenase n=1 Tax=Cyphellophora attinorum TaxID=1664694 RepID=A0A0N1HX27_9EURO|nr:3-hydroxybenzoate 4-monooxygenase [Phialophora attinorum]KPI42387.1 3-hydroxybenzoate 4-monooxygenase [Phialophora attinorum]